MERARAHYCASDGPLAPGGGSAPGFKTRPPVDVIYNSLVSAHGSTGQESLLQESSIKLAHPAERRTLISPPPALVFSVLISSYRVRMEAGNVCVSVEVSPEA